MGVDVDGDQILVVHVFSKVTQAALDMIMIYNFIKVHRAFI
jgi:hypothetical protein